MTREEAIRRIKEWKLDSDHREVLAVIIPELRESEDERIRKALIHLISEQDGILTAINGISVKDILSYLEKQKERAAIPSRETILGIWELGNIWKDNPEERNGLTMLQYIQDNWLEKCDYIEKPETAELSDDERARKEAISIVQSYMNICDEEGDPCLSGYKVLDYLEKQKIFSENGEGVYGYKDGKICFMGQWLDNSMYMCDAPVGQDNDGNLIYAEDLEEEIDVYLRNFSSSFENGIEYAKNIARHFFWRGFNARKGKHKTE